ncbi:MAG: helix-turn-helix domain-containing protein [Oscillospiraceae bacterium]|nr:helix-turn-helix domain-containing protein [Oscillospiraceae bacterium]
MEKYANRFSIPNEVMILKLSSKALAIYTYLLYCCDRKTYKCYPSYATIGENLQMSRGTVMKYVRELEDKLLISTEPTTITTKTGEVGNGNLMYTIEPIYKAMDNFYQEQLRDATEKYNIAKAQKKLEEYDRKHPRASA